MKALRIDVDGKMQAVEITGNSISEQNDCIYEMIGCEIWESVRLGTDAVMLVDEEGLLKALPFNGMASMIADRHLVGTALVVGIMGTCDGDVFCDCPERFLKFARDVRALLQ